MAVKTITIDLEAYDALARHKKRGESFSMVIKEHFGRRKAGRDLRSVIREVRLSQEALDAMDEQVRSRRRSRHPGASSAGDTQRA